jgi:hypothetical protein
VPYDEPTEWLRSLRYRFGWIRMPQVRDCSFFSGDARGFTMMAGFAILGQQYCHI